MNPKRKLELVSTDDFEGEHEAMDDEIKKFFQGLWNDRDTYLVPYVLFQIVKQSNGRLISKYQDIFRASKLIDEHEELQDALVEGFKSGFKPVRLCKLLRTWDGDTTSDVTSVEEGWEVPFVGDAAEVLWEHICHMFANPDGEDRASSSTTPGAYYARYCAIIQSSGMGKSRTVEEMSRRHFVIPIVLREPGSTGYPPSDSPAYEYLSKGHYTYDVFIRYCGFLHALFLEAASVLEKLEEPTASSFRQYMQNDMKFRSHGKDRKQFYENVANAAEEYTMSLYASYFGRRSSDPTTDDSLRSGNFPLHQAFSKLSVAIKHKQVPENAPQKRSRQSEPGPSILVAIDEIHILQSNRFPRISGTRLTELCRAMRGLHNESFFALFLSTSGTASDITPKLTHDNSTRTIPKRNVMLPFCDVGFDHRAISLNFSEPVSLSKVTKIEHLRSYGRPLWTCCPYRGNVILEFAVGKLLGGASKYAQMSTLEELACLAQRIPIEFLPTTYDPLASRQQKELVEYNLRVLLKIEDDLETMITASPSEPILSEAAYFLMTSNIHRFNPARALRDILKQFAVNKVELGEHLVELLFILARDKAIGPADKYTRPPSDRRWCLVPELLSSFFHPPSSTSDSSVVDIKSAPGWRFSEASVKSDGQSLAEVFKNSKVYFTHFIRAHEQKLAHVEFVMRLMARGAALSCADAQCTVEGIIPFLLQGDEIRRDNIGVIMFRTVENGKRITHHPNAELFLDMNPRTICGLDDIPVIRIIFALSATQPALKLVTHTSAEKDGTSYTTYDFWVAGFSPKVFAPMGEEGETWNSILERTKPWRDTYESEVDGSEGLRRVMNPGASGSREHWGEWCDYPEA